MILVLSMLIVCTISVVVAVAATLILTIELPFTVGAGLLIGVVAGEVYEARQQRKPIAWVRAAIQGATAGAAACLVLWLLMR